MKERPGNFKCGIARPDPIIPLDNVPGRTVVEIHPGNWPEDTRGCILVGQTLGEDFVGKSRAAMKEIMDYIDWRTFLDGQLNEETTISVTIKHWLFSE